jgi:hypothetical protein
MTQTYDSTANYNTITALNINLTSVSASSSSLVNKGYSDAVGGLYWTANVVTTPVGVSGTFVKIVGQSGVQTSTSDGVYFLTPISNRVQYIGSIPKTVVASASVTIGHTQGTVQILGIALAVNGVAIGSNTAATVIVGGIANIVSEIPLVLSPGDYVEAWCTNFSSANLVVASDLQLVLH